VSDEPVGYIESKTGIVGHWLYRRANGYLMLCHGHGALTSEEDWTAGGPQFFPSVDAALAHAHREHLSNRVYGRKPVA
jgi:hypothetical protein